VEGSGRDALEALIRNLPGETEEIHEYLQSGYPACNPSTSRIGVWRVTASPVLSKQVEMRELYKILVRKLKIREHMEDRGTDGEYNTRKVQ
jgi:hypothetical protein